MIAPLWLHLILTIVMTVFNVVPPSVHGATPASTNSVALPGNLVFGAGGMSGRFLVFDDWVVTKNYTLNTVIKHSSAIWVALTDPAVGDEPGVSAVWEKITDQTAASGTGAAITAGTADPTGGADGDAYFQVDSSSVVQSLWRNASGTWTEYTLPTGSGGGVTLSDASPENIAAAGNSGTSGDASRSDHIHDAFSTATPANLGVAASAGTGAFASRNDHVHRGLSDTDPADIGTTAPGTRPFASRDDHIHGGGGAANYRGNWVSTGTYARGDEVHNSSVYWIRNSTTGGSGGTPGNTNTDWYRIVGVETDQSTITGSGLGGNAIGIPNNGIALTQMSNDSVGLAELRDDATERLCPDPSGGTTGQVCATNGTAYALVDQTGGGGGTDDQTAAEVAVAVTNFNGNLGAADNDVQAAFETLDDLAISTAGTDDQTAAEVSVDATAFAGNLSITDTAVQTALNTIDGLTLGGSSGTASEATFKGALASTSTTAAAYANVFTITETVNVGGFSIETDVSAAGSQVVRVPVAGRYRACADVPFSQTTAGNNNARIGGHTRLAEVEDATTITADASHGTGYARAINNGLLDSAAAICTVLDLDLGDDVAVQFQAEAEAGTMSIDGGAVSLVLVGGLTGATGAVGPAGLDGTGAGDITAVTTASNSGLAGGAVTGSVALRADLSGLPTITTASATTTLAGSTAGGTTGKFTVGTVAAFLADGTTITETNGVLSSVATGTGDITAVTTANNSGLAGGALVGQVPLELDIANLEAVTSVTSISTTDTVAIESIVNSNETRKVTLDNIFTDFASTGIGALAGGGHFFDPTEIVATSIIAQDDNLIIEDESNSTNAARTVSVSLFADSLADGTTITASNGVLSSAASPLSDDQPVNIGPQGQQGTGTEASRDDHTHYLPHDNTLAFTSGALGVSISDVVEHLSERIQYYTEEADYSTGGSAAGQVYNTSRYPKNLQWVKAHLRVPAGVSDAIYRAGVYIVDENRNITAVLGQSGTSGILTGTVTHRFDFLAEDTSALGIPLEGGERIEVLIRRVGAGNTADTGLIRGSEHQNSPTDSYIDAENDFVLVNHVVIERENPEVGQGTDFHGEAIRGNLQLGYTITIDHGSLIGDLSNVDPTHINSGTSPRTDGLYADGSGVTEFRPAHPRPTGTWYGEGQTGQHNAPTLKTFLGGRYYRLTYESNSPDRHYEGGNAMGALVLDSAAATDYDLITRDSAAELRGDKKVIQLTAGRYRFKTKVWSNAEGTLEAGLFVYRSVSGDDTLAWFAAGGYGESMNDPLGTVETNDVRVIEFEEVVEHAVVTHYTQILVLEGTNSEAVLEAKRNVSFYTEIERLH